MEVQLRTPWPARTSVKFRANWESWIMIKFPTFCRVRHPCITPAPPLQNAAPESFFVCAYKKHGDGTEGQLLTPSLVSQNREISISYCPSLEFFSSIFYRVVSTLSVRVEHSNAGRARTIRFHLCWRRLEC